MTEHVSLFPGLHGRCVQVKESGLCTAPITLHRNKVHLMLTLIPSQTNPIHLLLFGTMMSRALFVVNLMAFAASEVGAVAGMKMPTKKRATKLPTKKHLEWDWQRLESDPLAWPIPCPMIRCNLVLVYSRRAFLYSWKTDSPIFICNFPGLRSILRPILYNKTKLLSFEVSNIHNLFNRLWMFETSKSMTSSWSTKSLGWPRPKLSRLKFWTFITYWSKAFVEWISYGLVQKTYVGLFLCAVCKANYLSCLCFATMSDESPHQHESAWWSTWWLQGWWKYCYVEFSRGVSGKQ